MLIAKTKQESDGYCDQEISHILIEKENKPFVLDKKVITNYDDFLVSHEFLQIKTQSFLQTKNYGTLAYYRRLETFLSSSYNRCCMALFCSLISHKTLRRGRITICHMEGFNDSLVFKEREFGGSSGVIVQPIKDIEQGNAYWMVLERNNNTVNGVQILQTKKINKTCKQEG